MAAMLDLIGSFIFGSFLLLAVMGVSGDMTASVHCASQDYIAQSHATALAEIVQEDLRKVGFGVSGTPVMEADSTQIRFLADLGADGTVDTVRYHTGSPDESLDTPNPRDRVLYRTLNTAPATPFPFGVTRFRLCYFGTEGDSLGSPTPLDQVRYIRIDLTVESLEPYRTEYSKTFMQLHTRPRNLGP